MFDNLINNLNDSFNIKLPNMSMQIVIPSGDISDLEDNANSFEKDGDFLGNEP